MPIALFLFALIYLEQVDAAAEKKSHMQTQKKKFNRYRQLSCKNVLFFA